MVSTRVGSRKRIRQGWRTLQKRTSRDVLSKGNLEASLQRSSGTGGIYLSSG